MSSPGTEGRCFAGDSRERTRTGQAATPPDESAPAVMAGLVPAIHALQPCANVAAGMPATSAGMTTETAAQREWEEGGTTSPPVMAGLVPAIHALRPCANVAAAMPATSPT